MNSSLSGFILLFELLLSMYMLWCRGFVADFLPPSLLSPLHSRYYSKLYLALLFPFYFILYQYNFDLA